MQYRREIDGLRAIAVVPVVLFHAGYESFGGGYVGVDVFFVISGFLITCILIAELEQDRFSILKFYERRARRILPALFFVILACLPFAYMWMLPLQLKDFGQSLVAVVFFVSNILFWHESGYFAADAELKPLLHTWSLAVEEQYYLIFPVFLLVFWRFGRSQVFWIVVLVTALSFLLAEWGWRNNPTANFYLAPFRAWELLMGSICAFLSVGKPQRSNNVLSAVGLVLIVYAVFAYDDTTPFPSAYALAPVAGTALIILFAAESTFISRLLSMRSLVGIGLISYSVYLWHQPLFAFARLRSVAEPSHAVMAALSLATLLLAWATWYWIESPFRQRINPVLDTKRMVFMTSASAGILLVMIGVTLHVGDGLSFRERNGFKLSELDAYLDANEGLHSDCNWRFNQSENCYTSDIPRVLLWGDSYAMHLAQGIISSDENVGLQQHTKSECSPILGIAVTSNRLNSDWSRECIDFNNQVLDWLKEQDEIDVVLLSSGVRYLLSNSLFSERDQAVIEPDIELLTQFIVDTANAIRQTGARVVFVSHTPGSGRDNGQCVSKAAFYGVDNTGCNFPLNTDTDADRLVRAIKEYIPVYWLHDDICENDYCHASVDGVSIYGVGGHLSKEASTILGKKSEWMDTFREMAD